MKNPRRDTKKLRNQGRLNALYAMPRLKDMLFVWTSMVNMFGRIGACPVGRMSEIERGYSKLSNLNIALKYKHQYGFSIVPIPCGQKGCVISWKEFQTRHASDNEIKQWWANDPDANIGVVTGDISDHLAVFDIDYYKDGKVLAIMQEILADYDYPVSLTPSGGQHWWFRMDKQINDFTPVVEGLDFRNLGLIVLPPSIGANGKRYSWESKLKDIERPTLPQNIISMVKERFNGIKQTKSFKSI